MDLTGEIQKVASMRLGESRSIWRRGEDVFSRSSRDEDDEEALRWAALEKLPTNARVRRAIVPHGLGDEAGGGAKEVVDVDVASLDPGQRRALLERLVRDADEDNERFLLKLKDRIDRFASLLLHLAPVRQSLIRVPYVRCRRVGIDMPTIEVRFEHLNAEAEVRVGSSGLPTIVNSVINTVEVRAVSIYTSAWFQSPRKRGEKRDLMVLWFRASCLAVCAGSGECSAPVAQQEADHAHSPRRQRHHQATQVRKRPRSP
jgi:hypothetical protein